MTSIRYELHEHRSLESPVLLLATESWVDAGFGAQAALARILEAIPTEPVATFDADEPPTSGPAGRSCGSRTASSSN